MAGYSFLPLESIPTEIYQNLKNKIEELTARFAQSKGGDSSSFQWRFFRPDDFNPTYTVDNRVYTSAGIAAAYTRLMNMVAALTIPTDNKFIIFGWFLADNPATPLSDSAVVRIRVNNLFKSEIPIPMIRNKREGICLVLNEFVELEPNNSVELECKDPLGGGAVNTLLFPIGVRIGPASQIMVT